MKIRLRALSLTLLFAATLVVTGCASSAGTGSYSDGDTYADRVARVRESHKNSISSNNR